MIKIRQFRDVYKVFAGIKSKVIFATRRASDLAIAADFLPNTSFLVKYDLLENYLLSKTGKQIICLDKIQQVRELLNSSDVLAYCILREPEIEKILFDSFIYFY